MTFLRAIPCLEEGIAGSEALQKGLNEKSAEFVQKGAQVYAKA